MPAHDRPFSLQITLPPLACVLLRGPEAITFAPRTPLLAAMHAVGRLLPRGNRAPAIEPISERITEANAEDLVCDYDLVLDGSANDFGTVTVGSAVDATFVVKNNGTGTLTGQAPIKFASK